MVAPHGRITALSLVALLLGSTFIIAAPTSAAASLSVTLSVPNGTPTPWPLETVVTVSASVTAIGSCGGLGTSNPTTATVTVSTAGRVAAANTVLTLTVTGAVGAGTASGTTTFTLTGNQTSGLEGSGTIPASVAFTGCVAGNPDTVNTQTNAINVDTKAPAVTYVSHAWTNSSGHLNVGGNVAGIGTIVPLTPSATDAGSGLVTFTLDTREVNGATPGAWTPGTRTDLEIETPGTKTGGRVVPSRNNVALPIYLNATDTMGNAASVIVTLNVDNVMPTTPVSVTTAKLVRSAAGARLEDVAGASGQVAIRMTSNGVTKTERLSGTSTATMTFGSSWDPIRDTITVVAFPSDLGGNTNFDVPSTILFPDGLTLHYNRQETAPTSIRGNEWFNLYVNITQRGPAYPIVAGDNADPLRPADQIWGELVRIRPGLTPGEVYWIPGTTGSDLDLDNAGSTGHFRSTPNAARDVSNDNDRTTRFQPATGSASACPGASPTCYLMANLSGRAFADGVYRLEITAKGSGDAAANYVKILHEVITDGGDPVASSHRNYSALGFGANMSDVHGMDGNPIRVKFNVTDWRRVVANGDSERVDSGLRNISFELFDPATGAVVTRTGGAPARIDITRTTCQDVLPYCIEMPESAGGPLGTCPGTANSGIYGNINCAYNQIIQKGGWANATFMNETIFSGWWNDTMRDLPAGKYKVRVSAWDNAGRNRTIVYGTGASDSDFYKVGPSVRIDPDSPIRVDEDARLIVSTLAGMRAHGGSKCGEGSAPSDWCPATLVRHFVTNNPNEALTGGTAVSAGLSSSSNLGTPRTWTTTGFSTALQQNGTHGSVASWFTNDVENWGWTYRYNNPPTLVKTSTFDPALPIYVRAEAVLQDGNTDVVKSTTGWIRVESSVFSALTVNEPAADWAVNLTGQSPTYNISFDRRTDPNAPSIELRIYTARWNQPDTLVATFTDTPDLAGPNTPRFKFNWTGRLTDDDVARSPLPAGTYRLNVTVLDGSSVLAYSDRFFMVLEAQPQVVVDTDAIEDGDAEGTAVRFTAGDPTYYVREQFQVPFKVVHGFANLTSDTQIQIALERGELRPGETRRLTKGQEGFDYTITPLIDLDENNSETLFTAQIVMPGNLVNNDPFDLNITVVLDPRNYTRPWHASNATDVLPLVLDKQAPAGTLLVRESEESVYDFTARKDKTTYAPQFIGFVEDFGSGVSKVEFRLYDVTADETFVFDHASDRTPDMEDGLTNDWVSATDASGTLLKLLPDTNGRRLWQVIPRPGDIDQSHIFRVDIRITDNLDQRSAINTTFFDFDAAPPVLGYAGRLGTPISAKSGIIATNEDDEEIDSVGWHGEGLLTVRVSDNDCLEAVYIKATFEGAPSDVISVPMEHKGSRNACYENFAAGNVHDGVKYTFFELDLDEAPNLTDQIGNYTYWFEAVDRVGQSSEIPVALRQFKMLVYDNAPAVITNITLDPPVGAAGGRAILRADVFDNFQVDRVEVEVRNRTSNALVGSGVMRPSDGLASNLTGIWVADTTEDLGFDLETGEYLFVLTPYDVFWNRSDDDAGPTCEDEVCSAFTKVYQVRDDGPPTVSLESPSITASVINATPTIRFLATNRNLETAGIRVEAGIEGEEAVIPAENLTFAELTATNGTRQGWRVTYSPGPLEDNATFNVKVVASVGGLLGENEWSWTVDALAPNVTAEVNGTMELGGRTWARDDTRVILTANDTVSSTTILYTVNGGQQQTYRGALQPDGADGEWQLEYWAVDAANNEAERGSILLHLDRTGPRITVSSHGDTVTLLVTDTGVGLNESSVVVHYRYGPTALAFSTKAAEKQGGNAFTAVLPGNASETGLAYYFTAEDLFGNANSTYTPQQPYVIPPANDTGPGPIDDLPPSVQITQPQSNAPGIRGALDLRWLASDPEGATLTISITMRTPTNSQGEILEAIYENTGSYRLNLTNRSAGAYTIIVHASDGVNSASDSVTFNVEAGDDIKIVDPPTPNPQLNQPVTFSLDIDPTGKSVTAARYRIIKDGAAYRTGNLSVTQGRYAASFTPTEAGDYRVLVDVAYSDGSTSAGKLVGTFTVAGLPEAPARIFHGSLIAVVAMAVLTAALAAYGAFGRWKK